MPNPYEAPKTASESARDDKQFGSFAQSLCAIVIGGVLVEYFGSYLAAFLLLLTTIVWMQDAALANSWLSSGDTLLFKAVGILFAFAGGWTAARIAHRSPVRHAFLSVLLANAIALPSWIARGLHTKPLSWLAVACCVFVAILGGKVEARRDAREEPGT